MRLNEKVCIVTGGASGIGRATCLLFAREGAKVVVADIAGAAASEVAKECGRDAIAIVVDVANRTSVRAMVDETVRRFGRIDVLVNNAGYGFKANVVDCDEDEWDKLIAVNLNGVFYGCKYAIPIMRAQGGGAIVNTSSALGSVGVRDRAPYCATKGAINALTRAMALDHVGENIRVNCIAPGSVETPIINSVMAVTPDPAALRRQLEARQAMQRMGSPEEIAYGILYLACDESSFVTGSTLTVDGGWTAQ